MKYILIALLFISGSVAAQDPADSVKIRFKHQHMNQFMVVPANFELNVRPDSLIKGFVACEKLLVDSAGTKGTIQGPAVFFMTADKKKRYSAKIVNPSYTER